MSTTESAAALPPVAARLCRPRRRTLVLALLVVVVLAAGVAVLGRHEYGQAPWAGPAPRTLHACGRDFSLRPPTETRAELTAAGNHLVRQGSTGFLGSQPLWTFDTVDGTPTASLAGGCHVVMWVQVARDSFRTYTLEGGP